MTGRRGAARVLAALVALLGAVALLAACSTSDRDATGSQQPQGANLRVTLGTQEFPEARILGELWRQALAVNGYAVDLQKGIGPAADLDDALQSGDIDGYVAYTGTVLSVVAGQEVTGLTPEQTYDRARTFYAGQDMVMSPMTPFENKDALATTRTFAEEKRLRSIADLRSLPRFTLGARPEFASLYLGLKGLEDRYGLDNARFRGVPLGEQYAALDDGSADVVDAYTTDPVLRSGDYRLLADPERLFGSQNVVMVVGEDKLAEVDQDRFLAVVGSVNEVLTEDVMVELNAEVESGRDETDVARSFLRENGLMRRLGTEETEG